jgi:cyanoexosortase A
MMIPFQLNFYQSFRDIRFWLVAIAIGLAAIHLTLTSRAHDGSLMASSVLYWTATGSLIWAKRNTLNLKSGVVSTLVGVFLIALVLIKSLFLSGYDPFLRISPLISALGVGLLASSFRKLKQYWQELIVLCFLAPPPTALSEIIDTSLITAKLSTLILWYSGFEVSRQGVYILLPGGGVEVYPGCSGIENMLHLSGLSVLFLFMFPTNRIQRFLIPIVALCIAFLVNLVRVALMAVLATASSQSAFEYWHKGDGSLLFSMISVALFGGFCVLMVRHSEPQDNIS